MTFILALIMALVSCFGLRVDFAVPDTNIVTEDGNIWYCDTKTVVFKTQFTNDRTDDKILIIL